MRKPNPHIYNTVGYIDLSDEEKIYALTIDLCRHLYLYHMAREHAFGLIKDEIAEICGEIEKLDMDLYEDLEPILAPVRTGLSWEVNPEACTKASNALLLLIVSDPSRQINPSDLSRHAIDSDTSANIKDEKDLSSGNLAVLSFHPTSGKQWKVTVVNKKGKAISSERFSDKEDAVVLFDSLE